MAKIVCFNDENIDNEEATLSIMNRGFKFGDGIFETVRIMNGEPLFLDRHFERLSIGIQVLGFTPDKQFTLPYLYKKILSSLETNGIKQGGKARITLYRNGFGNYKPFSSKWNYVIEVQTVNENDYRLRKEQKLILYPHYTMRKTIFSDFKTTNCLPFITAAIFAQSKNVDDVIFLNENQHITETTNANIFWVIGDEIFTPALTTGCLSGVFRNLILDTAEDLNIKTFEVETPLETLKEATEIFTTNVIAGIQPVISIEGLNKTYDNHTVKEKLLTHIIDFVQKNYTPSSNHKQYI